MNEKFYFTSLLVIFIFVLIFVGCGGDGNNGVIPSPSTPNNTDNTPNDNLSNGAYINVNVTWPQKGLEGKCFITSSGNDNTLTASMPEGTKEIIIRVRPVSDPNDPDYIDDPNGYLDNGYAEMVDPNTSVTLGPLPAIRLIVRAEAHDKLGPLAANMAISAVEKEFKLEFSDNIPAKNLRDACDTMHARLNVSSCLKMKTTNDNTYLPGYVNIEVHKK